MYKIIIVAFLFAITGNLNAQNTISGIITDNDTGEPLLGVTVYIPKIEKGSMTDLDGKFSIAGVPNGNYQLAVSYIGYATQNISLNIPLANNLSIKLIPSAIEMEEVIVSTPFHQLQSENVMRVERETVNDLKRSGAINLTEGIAKIPGVESLTTGAGIGKPVIRGLTSNRVLVYTQGVRLENQQFGDEHGLGVSSSGVESVEVIKGPASLLYGSDALGGVMYLNPEKYAIADSSQVDAALTYSANTAGLEGNLGYKLSGEKLKFLIRGNYATHSDYKTGGDYRVTNTRFKEADLKTGLGFQTDNYKADLRYNYNNFITGIPEEIGEQTLSKEKELPYQNVDNHVLSLDNTFFMNNSSFDVKLGYIYNDRKEYEAEHHSEEEFDLEDEEHPALEMHLNTLNYDVKYNAPQWGKFETIIGIQGMTQKNENFGMERLIPDARVNDFGIMATSHFDLEKVSFQAGLRYDTKNIDSDEYGDPGELSYISALNRNFSSYNGAFGIKYDIFRNFTSRLNIATGFRAPNLAELTANGTHEGNNRYEIGNPDLTNEQNVQLDLSLEYGDEHFEIFANAFYNKINDYIFLNPTSEILLDNLVYRYVQTNAILYGGEAGFHLHPHPVDWLHLESSVEMVTGQKDNDDYLPLIPATSFTNTLRAEFQKKIILERPYSFITLKTTLDQNKISEFETETPGYSLLSAGFGGDFALGNNVVNLSLSANNILDKAYISHLSRLKQDNIFNMGRNITAALHFNF